MDIGDLNFEYGIFLAPLAGITDIVFRKICRMQGAELVFSEMVSAKALYYGDKKTCGLTRTCPEERPVAVQIFGNDPEIMGYAAGLLSERDDVCIININMGCPMKKIVCNNEGAALMRDRSLSAKIIRNVVDKSLKPVTIKTRTGWDTDEEIIEFSKMAEDNGAEAVIVHGRTRQQMYASKADWDVIAKVKKSITVPVIGNGDIYNGEDALRAMKTSSVDGIMIGRGALGNPWIFKDIKARFSGLGYTGPSMKEIMETVLYQLDEMTVEFGEKRAVLQMRKHLAWYTRGMRNCSEFKNDVFSIKDKVLLTEKIRRFFEEGIS